MNLFDSKAAVFCTDVVGTDVNKASTVYLIGDAVLGVYVKGGGASALRPDDLKAYISQKPRGVSSIATSLTTRDVDTLHVHVNEKVYSALREAGVKASKIFIGFDNIIRYIRFNAWNKSGIVLCASHYRANEHGASSTLLIEEFSFRNGAVINFREKRVAKEVASSELKRLVADAKKAFSAEVETDLLVCGPAVNDLTQLIEGDIRYTEIEPFRTNSGKPVHIESHKSPQWLPYAVVMALSCVTAFGMTQYGKKEYQKAVASYQSSISGYEELFHMGSGPIDLLEQRKLYMSGAGAQKRAVYKLPHLLSAISHVRNDLPDINLFAKSIKFNLKTDGNADLFTGQPDYTVTLQFKKLPFTTPQEELKHWKTVFDAFSSRMPGVATVETSPLTFKVGDGSEVLLMTITGRIVESLK